MEITAEDIENLKVDEVGITQKIAQELNIRIVQAVAVITLLKDGATVPFIARYRKEQHGNLDEVQVRSIEHLFKSYCNLEERRIEIMKGIFSQGKLTDSLHEAVQKAATLTELEDLWIPFKRKRKTRGMLAIEKGLEPLADIMQKADDKTVEEAAIKFVHEDKEKAELSVLTVQDALNGASDIIAERTSQNTDNRKSILDFYMASGVIHTKGIGDENVQKMSVYKMYWDYSEELSFIKPHRVLAINRGEKEGVLEVDIEVDIEKTVDLIQRCIAYNNHYAKDAIEDGVVRLLSPAVIREIRTNLAQEADTHGIGIFSENLKNLLMTQPLKGTRVLGVDPGIRTGTKCAALDETGKLLGHFLIKQVSDPKGAMAAIRQAILEYKIQVVAVGNGTGSQEVQEIVTKVIADNFPNVSYTVVDESGASVYSASDIAREEFPDLDLTVRGAISMGRRLQDPLSELVKIDPKAIGVGLYQHDVNQARLSATLDEVVSSVVNQVGVNLNTASYSLLRYVSGINTSIAKKIVAFREQQGKILSRADLMRVSGLGPKAYEQCAGFLKIPESKDPLDNTWVHPENYSIAREILPLVQNKKDIVTDFRKKLEIKYKLGEQTVNDIVEELKRPNLDPRDSCPKPIMQKGVVKFEDLKVGMKVVGKVRNVVDFGAFVDLGLHETALIHVSEISDTFIKDPLEVIKVGDTYKFTIIDLDMDRKRISLSLKENTVLKTTASIQKGNPAEKKRVVVVKKTEASKSNPVSNYTKHSYKHYADGGSNDGTKYNPFATLLMK